MRKRKAWGRGQPLAHKKLTNFRYKRISIHMSSLEQYFAQLGATSFSLVSDNARSSSGRRHPYQHYDANESSTTSPSSARTLWLSRSVARIASSRWDATLPPSPSKSPVMDLGTRKRGGGVDSVLMLPARRNSQ